MKTTTRRLIASILALGLFAVVGQVGAAPETETQDPFLEQILQDYDS